MPADLDVYRDWLGITAPERPLSYYQLMRLGDFEDDPAKVRLHYRKMNAHVRKYAAGDFAKQSQELLNELARAMLCLTDTSRKADYDASRGRATPKDAGRRRSIEDLVLRRKVLTAEQLDKARKYSAAVGVEIRDALVQQKLVSPDVAMQLFAESLGLPYIDLAETTPDPNLLPKVPVLLARQHNCIPLMYDDGQLLMASPNPLTPEVEDELRLRTGMPVRGVLCTVASVQAVIDQHYTKEAAAAELSRAASASKGGVAVKSAPGADAAAADPEAATAARKRRLQVAAIVFNFAIIASMGYLMGLRTPTPGFFTGLAVSAAVAAAAGGTAFITMTLLKK